MLLVKLTPSYVIEGTINQIPQSDTLRNDFKNCRPLTLLNSTYTFLSSFISNRIKPTQETSTHPDKTGFISDKLIGENTHLLYYTLYYSKSHNIPELLVIENYAKAFDTIEWSFIDYCLQPFNPYAAGG